MIHFGPDRRLYVAIGSPCNICQAERDKYGVILRLDAQGKPKVFARGVRNSVGFDWHPATKELWFTDNGRDFLGNDTPPDELDRAPKAGLHFGFPYCHAGELPDPLFGRVADCMRFTAPALKLGPHVAALGMRFYDGKQFPPDYANRIFIAEHGSWNRKPPLGYRVMMVTLEDGKPVSYEPFAQGWLHGGSAWGRPVDVEVAPDGSLLVSDDTANVIYRITYSR